MTTATITSTGSLRDFFTNTNTQSRAKIYAIDSALVLSFALLTALLAQISITLPFTPVPITGQTLAVLISGAALGMKRGALSQFVYMILGLFLPFYSEGAHGIKIITGATGGYIIGFIFAAGIVGYLAEKGNYRKVLSSIGAFFIGTIVIYSFGAIWLKIVLDIPFANGVKSALALGVIPFVVGDIIKIVFASCALPASWKMLSYVSKEK